MPAVKIEDGSCSKGFTNYLRQTAVYRQRDELEWRCILHGGVFARCSVNLGVRSLLVHGMPQERACESLKAPRGKVFVPSDQS